MVTFFRSDKGGLEELEHEGRKVIKGDPRLTKTRISLKSMTKSCP